MAHPYPPHLHNFDYRGRRVYSLVFTTHGRCRRFADPTVVDLVREQFLRAGREQRFELTAYCFMPDHVHVLVQGLGDDSDGKAWISAAKQYSGYHFARRYGAPLWQRYGYERVVREDFERAVTIGYMVLNPVEAGLAASPLEYPFVGSERYTVKELMEIAEVRVGGRDCSSG